MRRYETVFIADPVLPEEELTSFRESFAAAIIEHDGKVLQEEDWGNRKLAYEVRKRREGHYVRFEYACADGQLPAELERRLRITEPVLKFLTIRIDNDKKRLVWEAKQAEKAARRAAEAAVKETAAKERAAKEEAATGVTTSAAAGAGDPGAGSTAGVAVKGAADAAPAGGSTATQTEG
ncbi:MAG: 30S ribosomal protein S6 [Acidobacteriota bacterium]